MQVNVTVSINGPSGQELSVVIGPDEALVAIGYARMVVPTDDLRQFVAALERVVGNAS